MRLFRPPTGHQQQRRQFQSFSLLAGPEHVSHSLEHTDNWNLGSNGAVDTVARKDNLNVDINSAMMKRQSIQTRLLGSLAHFLKTKSERPEWSIPGVASKTIGPGLSTYLWRIFFKKRMEDGRPAIESLDVIEFKHVAMNKCLLDLFVRPVDEKLVVITTLSILHVSRCTWELTRSERPAEK
jgi:hypothetical protein